MQKILFLARSITGETLSIVDDISYVLNNDLLPDISFVWLISEAIIWGVVNNIFWNISTCSCAVAASSENSVCEPFTDLPLVVLKNIFVVHSGKFIFWILSIAWSIIIFCVATILEPPPVDVAFALVETVISYESIVILEILVCVVLISLAGILFVAVAPDMVTLLVVPCIPWFGCLTLITAEPLVVCKAFAPNCLVGVESFTSVNVPVLVTSNTALFNWNFISLVWSSDQVDPFWDLNRTPIAGCFDTSLLESKVFWPVSAT